MLLLHVSQKLIHKKGHLFEVLFDLLLSYNIHDCFFALLRAEGGERGRASRN